MAGDYGETLVQPLHLNNDEFRPIHTQNDRVNPIHVDNDRYHPIQKDNDTYSPIQTENDTYDPLHKQVANEERLGASYRIHAGGTGSSLELPPLKATQMPSIFDRSEW